MNSDYKRLLEKLFVSFIQRIDRKLNAIIDTKLNDLICNKSRTELLFSLPATPCGLNWLSFHQHG